MLRDWHHQLPGLSPAQILSTTILRLGKSMLDRDLAPAPGTEDNARLGSTAWLLFHTVALPLPHRLPASTRQVQNSSSTGSPT